MQIRGPIDELRSTKLYEHLAHADPEYAGRITQFVEGVAPLLASTQRYFPYYTRHDAHHGFRVVRRIEQAVLPTCLKQGKDGFTAAEAFLLIAAAYAHDLGMTVFPNEERALLRSLGLDDSPGWQTHPLLQSHLRKEHSRRGGLYIQKHAERLGVPVNLVSALDAMMRAHNLSVAELDDEVPVVYAAQERTLDVRQMAAIVCVGDALEFSDTRVMDGVLDLIELDDQPSARVSYAENMKHVCVGDSLAIDEAGRVVVAGTFADENVLALAHRTFDQMEEWVQGYCDIDRRSSRPRLRVRPEAFVRNLAFPRGRFERLGVRLNKRSVIDLIASNAIWRTQGGIAVRELVQNAVEACRYRAYHSGPADRYEPAVQVEFSTVSRTVTVTDNGCGMSERTILNNLLTVGSSRSKEPAYSAVDYAPIARFGVGFWSVFTIAQRALVQTASFERYRGQPDQAQSAQAISFEVSLAELKDYTVFWPETRPCGTRVVLELAKDVVIDELFSNSRSQLLCCEVPVTFALDGQVDHVPKQLEQISISDVLGHRTRLIEDLGVRVFQWQGAINQTELSLAMAYRVVKGQATFLAEPGASLLNAIHNMSHFRTSVAGFSVPTRPGALCFELSRVGTLRANCRSPRGFDFAIDRRELIRNDASRKFARDMVDLVHTGYRGFLADHGCGDPQSIVELREQAAMHGGNVFDTFTGPELSEAIARYPDLTCFRLFPVHHGQAIAEPIHVDLNQLSSMTGTLFFMQNRANIGIGGGRTLSIDPESTQGVQAAFLSIQRWLEDGSASEPAYLMQANRLGSMLFDADGQSSVRYAEVDGFGHLCVQVVDLARVKYDAQPDNVIAEIQGPWSGAIYARDFNTPTGKPYQFLGRHRVLVQQASNLAQHLRELHAQGKSTQLAETIKLLQEDAEGFTAKQLSHLL